MAQSQAMEARVTGPDGLLGESWPVNVLRNEAVAGRLYAVLDACDAPEVPRRAAALGPRAASLYRGDAEERLWAIAPYLAAVDPDTLDWITGACWSEPWGIFAISDAPLESLRTHFRKFLTVEAPTGERLYFRFYDPRVLPGWLASCTPAERGAFFGPVERFATTDPETYGVRVIARRDAGAAASAAASAAGGGA